MEQAFIFFPPKQTKYIEVNPPEKLLLIEFYSIYAARKN